MNNQPILLWKHQRLANSFTLRIGELRYIGLIRTDKKGESYWKFKEFTNKNDGNSSNASDGSQISTKEEK